MLVIRPTWGMHDMCKEAANNINELDGQDSKL